MKLDSGDSKTSRWCKILVLLKIAPSEGMKNNLLLQILAMQISNRRYWPEFSMFCFRVFS